MNGRTTINNKEYELVPLRLKHLKEISKLLKNRGDVAPSSLEDNINLWQPYIMFSIKAKNPGFVETELDEMTLQEFLSTWNQITTISGIEVGASGGRTPMASTGASFTDASVLPSDGPILQ